MKRHATFAAAVALVASAGIAHAGGTAQGEIAGIDWERNTVQLDTGEEFTVPQHELTQLSAGDRVIITFEEPGVAQTIAADTGEAAPGTMDPAEPAAGVDPATDPADVGAVEGEIIGVDHERQTITLDTGEEFVVAEHELVQLSPGQRVVVPSFEERDGQLFADTVFQATEIN